MDNSEEFQTMLDGAIRANPDAFKDFDGTKNVQDQLQEMVADRIDWLQDFHKFWYAFFGDEDSPCGACMVTPMWASGAVEPVGHGVMQFDSWEQLWLAFVMKEKYGKCWNGEEWLDRGCS